MGDERASESRVIGKELAGKYRIDGFLKRGGMGAVYKGTHLMLGKPVAIKLINPELVTSADIVDRFQREARAAANLTHPNIVIVHDLGQTAEGELYIAMELVGGRSLKQVIKEDGPMDPDRAVRQLKAMCSALALAHRNAVIHRDLKPQNIMVTEDSEGNEVPKILDFGIAKTFEPDSTALTATGTVIGTPQYMSPEQAKGMEVDMRSDLYSLGIILYEMLVGKVPFDDNSVPAVLVKHLSEMPAPPRQLRADLSPALEAVVLRTLEKDPENRYQSAEELSQGLEQALVGVAPLPPPIPATQVDVPTVAETAVTGATTRRVATRPTAPVAQPLPPRPPDSRASKTGLFVGLSALAVLLLLGFYFLVFRSGPGKVDDAAVETPTGAPAAASLDPSSSATVESNEAIEGAEGAEPGDAPPPPAAAPTSVQQRADSAGRRGAGGASGRASATGSARLRRLRWTVGRLRLGNERTPRRDRERRNVMDVAIRGRGAHLDFRRGDRGPERDSVRHDLRHSYLLDGSSRVGAALRRRRDAAARGLQLRYALRP